MSGNIYVTDTLKNCIQKLDSSGNLIAKWGSKTDYKFDYPHGILAGEDGYVYVLD
jgi:tripartite motif-containing protein 71